MHAIDPIIQAVFGPVAEVLAAIVFIEIPVFGGVPVIVLWLMAAAIFMTVWLRFQPITGLGHSIGIIRGKASAKTDPGEVSSFQALATELSGTVGLGNIAGVAVAISVGGPGAALWIIIFGVFAMSVKMAEATLGVKYRRVAEDGTTRGGPMYYLRDGLAEIGLPRLGLVLGGLYAVFAVIGVFGAGNLFQANQVTAVVLGAVGVGFWADNRWLLGVVLAIGAAAVILGGITSIARWTARITPAMAILYAICALAVVGANIDRLPAALATIVTGAFTPEGATGGVIGVAVVGIQRALFSNAAGVGSAGMAHSASKTKDPATEGFTAMWEPLIDSVVVCTLTALAITVSGAHEAFAGDAGADGVAITATAFSSVSSWFPVLLTVSVVLFGFSTILSYSYYGELAAAYLFGDGRGVRVGFRIFWVLAVIVGAASSLDAVILFSDAMFFLMSVPNLLGLYLLGRVVRLEILRRRVRADTGTLPVIAPELQVGMGDHEPTPEQVAEAARVEEAEAAQIARVRRTLAEDPDFPVRAEHHDDDLASPMGVSEDPIPDGGIGAAASAGRR